MARLPYYGTNKCDPTEPVLTGYIIIRDNKQGPYMLIDVAISGDRNVIKKEAEQILKYTSLLYIYSACRM
jgi:hypothetical protein